MKTVPRLQWIHELHGTLSWNTFKLSIAAENGRMDVMQWMREKGCPWDGKECLAAAENGHLDILKWLQESECRILEGETCNHAAKDFPF